MINSAALSAMATKTELGGPDGRLGNMLASTTLNPLTPRTLVYQLLFRQMSIESTTLDSYLS